MDLSEGVCVFIKTIAKECWQFNLFLFFFMSSFFVFLSSKALTLCGVLLFLYGLLSSVAPSFGWLLLLRGLVGFAIGCVPQSYVRTTAY